MSLSITYRLLFEERCQMKWETPIREYFQSSPEKRQTTKLQLWLWESCSHKELIILQSCIIHILVHYQQICFTELSTGPQPQPTYTNLFCNLPNIHTPPIFFRDINVSCITFFFFLVLSLILQEFQEIFPC